MPWYSLTSLKHRVRSQSFSWGQVGHLGTLYIQSMADCKNQICGDIRANEQLSFCTAFESVISVANMCSFVRATERMISEILDLNILSSPETSPSMRPCLWTREWDCKYLSWVIALKNWNSSKDYFSFLCNLFTGHTCMWLVGPNHYECDKSAQWD